MKMRRSLLLSLILGLTAAVQAEDAADPAEIAIGERLFLETRFAQAYATDPGKADPAMAVTATTTGEALPGPFAGQTMNCRACHMVDEHADHGMRTYADYARRPPIPAREDGEAVAVRNSQSLVSSAISREGSLMLHFDGEFSSLADLVTATLTGRNYGWLPGEYAQAVRHIAGVIRSDDGRGELARESGGSYRKVLAGNESVPAELRLPAGYRVDVDKASDAQVVAAVAKLIGAYVADLDFARDEEGLHNGSPYDAFLAKNGLDRAPRTGESPKAYGRRLFTELQGLKRPVFVKADEVRFETHRQTFVFGEKELAGLKVFLNADAGNCVSCHAPPAFTDFGLHNTGASQLEYDRLHGDGAFAALVVPDAAARVADDLPPSGQHPAAGGRFRAVPSRAKPGFADLGAWNTVLNPDLPRSQAGLREHLCESGDCSDDQLLARAFGAFKTPTVRDLGHSGPYLHDGSLDSVEDAVAFYAAVSELARAGKLRNADPEIARVRLGGMQQEQLAAFLKALNEDYD